MNRKEAIQAIEKINAGHGGGGSFPVLVVQALEALGLLQLGPELEKPIEIGIPAVSYVEQTERCKTICDPGFATLRLDTVLETLRMMGYHCEMVKK